jgi:hypothetical protein
MSKKGSGSLPGSLTLRRAPQLVQSGVRMADWLAQEAVKQTIFREMNEWTEDDTDGRDGLERAMDTYLCECGDALCSDPIRLTRSEYEGIRSEPPASRSRSITKILRSTR